MNEWREEGEKGREDTFADGETEANTERVAFLRFSLRNSFPHGCL